MPAKLSPATPPRQFFDPMRFVRGGNLIDLDWLVEATSQQMPLAMNYAEAQFALGKELWMCACRGDDYSPAIFRRRRKRGWI
jgi:predicted patatin/cPLA2 family phospholipase